MAIVRNGNGTENEMMIWIGDVFHDVLYFVWILHFDAAEEISEILYYYFSFDSEHDLFHL